MRELLGEKLYEIPILLSGDEETGQGSGGNDGEVYRISKRFVAKFHTSLEKQEHELEIQRNLYAGRVFVPEPRGIFDFDQGRALVMRFINGRSANDLLCSDPNKLNDALKAAFYEVVKSYKVGYSPKGNEWQSNFIQNKRSGKVTLIDFCSWNKIMKK